VGEIIVDQPPLLIELGVSRLLPGQLGLFAARALPQDQVIAHAAKLGETLVTWTDFARIDAITQAKIKRYCLLTPEGAFTPQDINYLTPAWYMNHSCGYNVGLDEQGNFVTSQAVAEGQELFWDYGMGVSYPEFKLECRCGSANCRKVITGNDWKNPAFVKRNRRYFLRELLARAEAHGSGSPGCHCG